MKKAAVGCLTAVCVLVALIAVTGRMHDEQLGEQPPLTLGDLERIEEAVKPAAKPESAEAVSATPPVPVETPADLPHRLDRVATDEQRRTRFIRDRSLNRMEKLGGYLWSSPLGSVIEVAAVAAGERSVYYERGQNMLSCGNWSAARNCFMQALEKWDDPLMQRQTCFYLAWLEDDPEMAARYMELACSAEDESCLIFCLILAQETGSTELAEHYQTRLQKVQAARPGVPR